MDPDSGSSHFLIRIQGNYTDSTNPDPPHCNVGSDPYQMNAIKVQDPENKGPYPHPGPFEESVQDELRGGISIEILFHVDCKNVCFTQVFIFLIILLWMLERMKRIAFRLSSDSSKVEPEPVVVVGPSNRPATLHRTAILTHPRSLFWRKWQLVAWTSPRLVAESPTTDPTLFNELWAIVFCPANCNLCVSAKRFVCCHSGCTYSLPPRFGMRTLT